MKQLLLPANATFSASGKTITFATTIPASISAILHVTNVTRGVLYFQPQAGATYTGTYASPVLTLACSTTGHADADKLEIFYDDGVGQSTATAQTTGNNSLSSIDGKITAVNTGAVVLAAGSALVGNVGIDQTTPGTTNLVAVSDGTSTISIATAGADAASNTANRQRVQSLLMAYNGSTVDRVRAGVVGETGAATGYANVLPATGAVSGASIVASNAAAASLVIKASAGTLMSLVGYNGNASAQFIQVHNTTTVVADTAVPIYSFTVPATSNFSLDVPVSGSPFTTGIMACNSSTQATKTIGSSDCWFTAVIK